jgi:CBS domain-containing protein
VTGKEHAMFVKQCMEKDLVTVYPDASLKEVAGKMRTKNVGSVLVIDDGWNVKGILTDRDIAICLGTDGRDPASTVVREVMSADPVTIESEADLDAAIRLMNRSHVTRLPVTDHGRLAGILSATDIARYMREEFDQFIGIEESYIKH